MAARLPWISDIEMPRSSRKSRYPETATAARPTIGQMKSLIFFMDTDTSGKPLMRQDATHRKHARRGAPARSSVIGS